MAANKLISALEDLTQRKVSFILVGGMAAVVQGAPLQTLDIDLVYDMAPENTSKLLVFLQTVDAVFRMRPELRPGNSHLEAGGHLNLITKYGPLDLLGFIGNNRRFRELQPLSQPIRLTEELMVPVLGLETIISIKEELGHPKDLRDLPLLRETLRQRSVDR